MCGKRLLFSALILVLALSALTACAPAHPLAMASMADMPGMVQSAPERTQQAYQFAVANQATLQQVACYCGCYKLGHKSNYDCYVSGVDDAGRLTFDDHALGCGVCVDITQDVMSRLRDGESMPNIQAYIDRAYAKYGLPTGSSTESGG